HGDVLPRELLRNGFLFRETRIPLVSPQGIFKPKNMDLPLTITTTPGGPYDDSFDYDDNLMYKYRGTDPMHRDNVGLRLIMQEELPLIYFHGIIPGRYLAIFPVFIVGDSPDTLTFTIAVDDKEINADNINLIDLPGDSRRTYITTEVRQRLHQRGFRERVIAAYRSQCAFCALKHTNLLDAAHIVPDNEPDGLPTVNNGIALCKIHHAVFDQYIIGITPDYQLKVRTDILEEIDGPMLRYGIQELHNHKLILPKSKNAWPNRELLDRRYSRFRDAV
ncbi:MAG: HNH endonuclease, partial [Candidatus Paceibacterota bacterium]